MSDQGGQAASDGDTGAENLEAAVCRIVRRDPFATIREIRREINFRGHGSKVSVWRVICVLRRKRLLRRSSRFRYAWGRS